MIKIRKKLFRARPQQLRPHLVQTLSLTLTLLLLINYAQTISIKPADFDRLIMPCYLGQASGNSYSNSFAATYNSASGPSSSYNNAPYQQQQQQQQQQQSSSSQQLGTNYQASGGPNGGTGTNSFGNQPQRNPGAANQNFANQGRPGYDPPASYFGANDMSPSRSTGNYARDGFSSLGQSIARANTMDNFIALVSKIEAQNPRLAQNPDLLIKTLLNRFRMDNYYYDVKTRMAISEQDHRTMDILPALLNSTAYQANLNSQYSSGAQFQMNSFDDFQEQLLEPDEKCSMYFMLSHFIVKESPSNPPLSSLPVPQLAGSQSGQRAPVLQAAGAGYPGQSANSAFSGAANSQARYPGPSPSFGSPATSNMNSFGSGIGNQLEPNGNNQLGMNVLQPNERYQNLNLRSPLSSGFNTPNQPFSKFNSIPFVDGGGQQANRFNDHKQAIEFGVVTLPNQENAAIVLNRVLLGLMAANTYPKEIRELASLVYPNQYISQTSKLADDIDPLYAVTLADLWAISAIPKAGKAAFDLKLLGNNGRWNDSMCPTSFLLDKSSQSVKFTTAELLGGLDGLNLGMLRKSLLAEGKNLKLSDLLRMYYSRAGFRPQFAEFGVCSRSTVINTKLDELKRQAENYLRLYQLNLPTSDNDLALSIMRVDSFKEFIKLAANQFLPQEICQLTGDINSNQYNDIYPNDLSQEQCELGKADVVSILDSSPQANQLFMSLVLIKLAQKIGLSRTGNSLTILTNQQDTNGGSSFNFNPILRNSTNTAEIGCSLAQDTSRMYQGGQISEPTKLMEMFERALVNLDTEYLIRQNTNYQTMSQQQSAPFYNRPTSYVSSLFSQQLDMGSSYNGMPNNLRPKNTGGSKVIIWFNYNPQSTKQASLSSGPTNWNQQPPASTFNNDYKSGGDQQARFQEAKRYLRENFRGAAILAVSSGRDEMKPFVYDEQRDIFADIPSGPSGSSSGDYYSPSSSSYGNVDSSSYTNSIANLNGPADILVSKLLQRMCDIPALFQYPMCFRAPSEGAVSAGYISPKRKQYWMMSPKTFFSSQNVRMAFKADGGRLRVCFGRMPNPDESAARNPQQQQQMYGSISLGGSQQNQFSSVVSPAPVGGQQQQQQQPVSYSGNNYYTGLDYGICKDVSPGQEIDFIVSDPCYRKSIADCEPFYFVIKEITNPGEGDPNYMCRDAGCKRFDQVKFTMTHTGVQCNGSLKSIRTNWVLIMISILVTCYLSGRQSDNNEQNHNQEETNEKQLKTIESERQDRGKISLKTGSRANAGSMVAKFSILFLALIQQVQAQLSAPADFGQGRYGEKRGNFTPSEVLAIILLVMTILVGLCLTIALCYYVSKRSKNLMTRVELNDY